MLPKEAVMCGHHQRMYLFGKGCRDLEDGLPLQKFGTIDVKISISLLTIFLDGN